MKKQLNTLVFVGASVGASVLFSVVDSTKVIADYTNLLSIDKVSDKNGGHQIDSSTDTQKTYFLKAEDGKNVVAAWEKIGQATTDIYTAKDVKAIYQNGPCIFLITSDGEVLYFIDNSETSKDEVKSLGTLTEKCDVYDFVSDKTNSYLYYVSNDTDKNEIHRVLLDTKEGKLTDELVSFQPQVEGDKVTAITAVSYDKGEKESANVIIGKSLYYMSGKNITWTNVTNDLYQGTTNIYSVNAKDTPRQFYALKQNDSKYLGVIYQDDRGASPTVKEVYQDLLGHVNQVSWHQDSILFATAAKSLFETKSTDTAPTALTSFWNWYNPEKGQSLSATDDVLSLDDNSQAERYMLSIKPHQDASVPMLFASISVTKQTPLGPSHTKWQPYTPATPTPENNNPNLGLIIGLSVGIPLAVILVAVCAYIYYKKSKSNK